MLKQLVSPRRPKFRPRRFPHFSKGTTLWVFPIRVAVKPLHSACHCCSVLLKIRSARNRASRAPSFWRRLVNWRPRSASACAISKKASAFSHLLFSVVPRWARRFKNCAVALISWLRPRVVCSITCRVTRFVSTMSKFSSLMKPTVCSTWASPKTF